MKRFSNENSRQRRRYGNAKGFVPNYTSNASRKWVKNTPIGDRNNPNKAIVDRDTNRNYQLGVIKQYKASNLNARHVGSKKLTTLIKYFKHG